MLAKTFEIRDAGTFMPMLAVRLTSDGNEKDRYLLRRVGLDHPASYKIAFFNLNSGEGHLDLFDWPGAPMVGTLPIAHGYIEKHFDELESGAVIDVEFILGETKVIKISESEETL